MTNIFLVKTQYHLIVAINLITDKFFNEKNIVYYVKGGRIKFDIEYKCDYMIFMSLRKGEFGNKTFKNNILEAKPKNFHFFQENCSETQYLLYHLKQNKINIALLQDGTKPYHLYKKKRLFLNIVRDTLRDYTEMVRRLSMAPVSYHNNFKYAYSSRIDDVYLSYPDAYKNVTKKRVLKLPDYNAQALGMLYEIFNFKINSFNRNAILYIGQAWKEIYWEKELEIFISLVDRYPDREIIYKSHPNSDIRQISLYKGYKNVKIIDDNIPAELYVLTMENTMVLSAASTAMLTDNKSCKFYYTYKLYQFGRIFTQVEIGNPTLYIRNISDVNELVL